MKHLPTLYKLSSKGKLLQWDIGTEGADIVTRHGQLGGKIQVARETIAEGKNLGRANATTPEQQAAAEAQSEWDKQVSRKGYTPDRAKAEAGDNDQDGVLSPMLAQRFDERGEKYAVYPGYAQIKFDGLRCIAHVLNGVVNLWSRERKPIGLGLRLLRAELAKLFPTGEHILDGEIFNLKIPFETITSYVKDTEYQTGNEAVQYHVYDYPSIQAPFGKRYEAYLDVLQCADGTPVSNSVLAVETTRIADPDAFEDFYRACVEAGQEGAMYRNDAPYDAGKRSNNLLKMKPLYEVDLAQGAGAKEEEFPIVGVRAGRGKFLRCAIFRCRMPNKLEFDCNAPGDLLSRAKYLDDPNTWHGKLATVVYGGLTKRGVPRFPNCTHVREPGL